MKSLAVIALCLALAGCATTPAIVVPTATPVVSNATTELVDALSQAIVVATYVKYPSSRVPILAICGAITKVDSTSTVEEVKSSLAQVWTSAYTANDGATVRAIQQLINQLVAVIDNAAVNHQAVAVALRVARNMCAVIPVGG
jgi:hypothetical protein